MCSVLIYTAKTLQSVRFLQFLPNVPCLLQDLIQGTTLCLVILSSLLAIMLLNIIFFLLLKLFSNVLNGNNEDKHRLKSVKIRMTRTKFLIFYTCVTSASLIWSLGFYFLT